MYLLADLIVQNLEIFRVDLKSYKEKSFSGPNWPKQLFWNIFVDIDGSDDSLKMKCLKPNCGSGNTIDDTPKHLPEDIGDFNLWNIIAGPLVPTPKGSTQFEAKNYEHAVEIFNQVEKN